ncbi:PHD finger protein 14-like isoform X1 [Rhopalosiphum maidis]|uniref:PHD finger protein 14-like isoform X1 n=1 Tax=Rhopalosiphum maidis TaxID=43146 RepID=UPI000EFFA7F8|nr:PHD finger protein 14-like isoform X1 [Rhopalosiphum maidis]
MERGPGKRRIKPPVNLELIDFYSESSSDSDFNIEDHYVNSESDSGDSNFSFTDDGSNKKKTEEDDGNKKKTEKDDKDNIKCSNDSMAIDCTNLKTPKKDDSIKVNIKEIVDTIRICSICLGDDSDVVNELIDCDECGISVHEGCYGISDSESVNSSISSYSTEPWFCEACKAGVENPTCELCPNLDGIFKETDNGRWVHLVCALYVPGITFGDVTSLSKPKLFAHGTPQWGNKSCTLCKDYRFSSTGVTISCDAGMCRTQFHVTCSQQEGGLSDVTSPETDQSDPFYAHCKMHGDKLIAKNKKRNWQILQLRTNQMKLKREQLSSEKSTTWERNQRWLRRLRSKYEQTKQISIKTESTFKSKVPRAITTSASSCRALWLKADLMGINTTSQEVIERQIKELRDVPKKWNVPPAFSLEFVSYFSDRNLRLTNLKNQLKHFTDQNNKLRDEQKIAQEKYNQELKKNEIQKQKNLELENVIKAYHNIINLCNPYANILDVDIFAGEVQNDHCSYIGFSDNVQLDLYNKCSICSHTNDQHLLAKCDTCRLYYHLRCLNPPLTRMPKKTKLFGWQCSDCENSNSFSEQQIIDKNAPRQLRCGGKKQSISDNHKSSSFIGNDLQDFNNSTKQYKMPNGQKKDKKHEQNKKKDSNKIITNQVKAHKRKHKYDEDNNTSKLEPSDNLTQHGIKLFIKTVPSTSGVKTTSSKLLIGSPADTTLHTSKITKPEKSITPLRISTISTDIMLTPKCKACHTTGTRATMVQCDECSEYFHFFCLDPPVKKTPKVIGYSWHCEECDPTDSD